MSTSFYLFLFLLASWTIPQLLELIYVLNKNFIFRKKTEVKEFKVTLWLNCTFPSVTTWMGATRQYLEDKDNKLIDLAGVAVVNFIINVSIFALLVHLLALIGFFHSLVILSGLAAYFVILKACRKIMDVSKAVEKLKGSKDQTN